MEVQRNPYGLPNVIFTISKSLPALKDAEQVRELLYESDQRISGHQGEAPSSQPHMATLLRSDPEIHEKMHMMVPKYLQILES